ncbi:MAG TPA: S41 family peptidase [Gemmatimonadaceae bacterium]|nr:S41 family peptidase [Gemmatimonadaceae bacterium]
MKTWLPVLLMTLAATGCVDAFLGPAPATDHGALFDDVWQQFDLHYSFFTYKNIDWDSLGARYRPLAVAAATDQAFADVLGQMVARLGDVHASITPGSGAATIGYVSPWDTIPAYFNPGIVFARYVQDGRLTAGRHIRYGMVAATVGYVRIASFVGSGWASEMDAALDSMPAARGLVIDVRNNRGGDVTLAVNIARRFADRERTYAYVRLRNGPGHGDFTADIPETVAPRGHRFDGRVYVLTNRRDFSAAEDFVLAMRTSGRVTVVGDTTAGASGGPIVRQLPNGWTFELSEWLEYTPGHRLFEGIGLAPDVVVKATAGAERDSVDLVVERALSLAAGGP